MDPDRFDIDLTFLEDVRARLDAYAFEIALRLDADNLHALETIADAVGTYTRRGDPPLTGCTLEHLSSSWRWSSVSRRMWQRLRHRLRLRRWCSRFVPSSARRTLPRPSASWRRLSGRKGELQREVTPYKFTSIAMRIQKNVNLLTLEGTRAPELDRSEGLGAKTLSLADVKGKVTVLFFWAHWCPDCKNEAPILKALLDKYKGRDVCAVAAGPPPAAMGDFSV